VIFEGFSKGGIALAFSTNGKQYSGKCYATPAYVYGLQVMAHGKGSVQDVPT